VQVQSNDDDDDDDDDEDKIPVDEEGNEVAMFVPKKGLVGGDFWHEYDEERKIIREDRAILFQSQENYNHIIANERFKSCFDGIDYMESATFGEQVIVNGIETSQLAIGDVFVIEEDHSPLVIEITAPRKPCNYINTKHGTKYGTVGLQTYTHQNCLAGWFARVLVAGELKDGMKFTRKAHPNPKWTLPNTYKALYWEGNRRESLMNTSSWNRSRNELEELIRLPQLGECEWKADGRALLMKMDGIDLKTVRADLIDLQIDPRKSKRWHTDPDLLEDNVSNTHIFFEYLCMTEVYQSMNEVLKFLGITN
jgi:MOSC domain-containing protein YiiM